MLSVIDGLWKDHLLSMDHLKEGISLRGYAQRDPLVEYKRESFDMFEAMMLKFQEDTVAVPVPDADSWAGRAAGGCGAAADGYGAQCSAGGQRRATACGRWGAAGDRDSQRGSLRQRSTSWRRSSSAKRRRSLRRRAGRAAANQASLRSADRRKGGRNDPCPCGSGKKYKKCHGA